MLEEPGAAAWPRIAEEPATLRHSFHWGVNEIKYSPLGSAGTKRVLSSVAVACLLLKATGTGAADPYTGAADCEAYARQVERNQGRVLGGAGRGAVRGAALGAVLGDNSESARRGAKLGAVAGGLRRAGERRRAFDQAYAECMRDRRDDE